MCIPASFLLKIQQKLQEKEDRGVTVTAEEWPSGALSSIPSFSFEKETFFTGLSTSKTVTELLLNLLEEH